MRSKFPLLVGAVAVLMIVIALVADRARERASLDSIERRAEELEALVRSGELEAARPVADELFYDALATPERWYPSEKEALRARVEAVRGDVERELDRRERAAALRGQGASERPSGEGEEPRGP